MESRSEVRLMLDASVEREANMRAVDGVVEPLREVLELAAGFRSSMRVWAYGWRVVESRCDESLPGAERFWCSLGIVAGG